MELLYYVVAITHVIAITTLFFVSVQSKWGREDTGVLKLGLIVIIVSSTSVALYRYNNKSRNDSWMPTNTNTGAIFVPQRQALEFLQKEVRGSVVVSAPSTATQYKPFKAELRLAPDKLSPLLASVKATAPTDATVVGKENVWLSPVMEASVYGTGFEFEPKEKQTYSQVVAVKEPTTWTWQVTPVDAEPLTLTYKLNGKFQLEGKGNMIGRDLYDQSFSITVDVNPEGFFKRNWVQLLTMIGTVVVAVVGALWAYFKWWRPTRTPTVPSTSAPATGGTTQGPKKNRGKR
jgi:hypothetical protein